MDDSALTKRKYIIETCENDLRRESQSVIGELINLFSLSDSVLGTNLAWSRNKIVVWGKILPLHNMMLINGRTGICGGLGVSSVCDKTKSKGHLFVSARLRWF